MAQKPEIGVIDQEHDFLRDNEFIEKGYRLNFSTTRKIIKSLFMVHNELFNVWSHLLGALIFLLLLVICLQGHQAEIRAVLMNQYEGLTMKAGSLNRGVAEIIEQSKTYEEQFESTLKELYEDAELYERRIENALQDVYSLSLQNISEQLHTFDGPARWPLVVFILAAVFCLGCSAAYHLFNAHSKRVNFIMSRLDYAGISILITGSFYPAVFYSFFCSSVCIWVYLCGITAAGVAVFVVTMSESFHRNELRWLRGCVFLTFGLLGVVPFVHALTLNEAAQFMYGGCYMVAMAASYIIGVQIYINRIPERFYSGSFDMLGNSHNIWHLFVLMGAFFHYCGCLELYWMRAEADCLDYPFS